MSILFKYSFVFVFLFVLVMPMVFVNATGVPPCKSPEVASADGKSCVNPAVTKVEIKSGVENPIDVDNLADLISIIIKSVLIVGIPILVLAIIYAGFLFVKAQGNSEELTKAKNTLLYTVIGGALLLGAFVIANAIGATVTEIKRTT